MQSLNRVWHGSYWSRIERSVSDASSAKGLDDSLQVMTYRFAIIYRKGKGPGYGNCGKCGSHTLANTKCWVTFNYCKDCSDANGGEGVPLPDVCPPLAINSTRFLPWEATTSDGGQDARIHASALWPSTNWAFLANVTSSAYLDSSASNSNYLPTTTSSGIAAATSEMSADVPTSTPYNERVLTDPSA